MSIEVRTVGAHEHFKALEVLHRALIAAEDLGAWGHLVLGVGRGPRQRVDVKVPRRLVDLMMVRDYIQLSRDIVALLAFDSWKQKKYLYL